MWGGIHDNRPIQGDIMPYCSRVYPAWPLESSKTPRKLWHTWGSLYVPVYKVNLFLNALSFKWKLRITIFNMKEQLQSFHFNVHIRISCTGCLLAEIWKQKVHFSNLAKVKFKLCCVKWWKTKNSIYLKVLTNRFLFEWLHPRILSTDIKVRTTMQDSNIHSGSNFEFNEIEKWNQLSYL